VETGGGRADGEALDLTGTPSPSKESNSRGKISSAVPFANVIPLGLGQNETGRRLSLSEFVAADIEAVLPGLLNDSERPSFIEFLLSRVSGMLSEVPGYRLEPTQLESLGLGKCVTEEIADIWCRLVGHAMGATFWDGAFVPGCQFSDRFGMHLARGTDSAKTLVFPCNVTLVLLADPKPVYLPERARSEMLSKLKEGIGGFSRLLFSRQDALHFTTIDMLRTNTGNCREISARLADSGSTPQTLKQSVLYALNSAVPLLFEDTALKAGPGIEVPLQDNMNDCCFHTVLYQASVLSGKPMPDAATCRRDAARLRSYTVLLAYAEGRLLLESRGADFPPLQQLWREWKAAEATRHSNWPAGNAAAADGGAAGTEAAGGGGAARDDHGTMAELRSVDMGRCRLAN
jgi:hypothetical protein